jgi:translation initiation factor 3 subunit D
VDFNGDYLSFEPLSHDEFVEMISLEPENPFAPIGKHEKILGKIMDFTATAPSLSAGGRRLPGRRGSATEITEDGANPDSEEWSIMADQSKPSPSSAGTAPPRRGTGRGSRGGYRAGAGFFRRRQGMANRVIREPSIQVEPDWSLLEEIEFSRLAKLSFAPDDQENPKLLESNEALALSVANPSALRSVNAKAEKPLGLLDVSPGLSSRVLFDEKLLSLAKHHGATVVTTAEAVSALMSCSKSVLPWDLSCFMHENMLVVDLRPGWTPLDTPSVNENAYEPPVADKEHINGAMNLAAELARINAKISSVGTPSEAVQSAYRYCLWDMGDGLKLLVRCIVNYRDESSTGVLSALLEYEPGKPGDWRSRLDTQRAAIIATEAKNNAAIISRWLYGAILANVSAFKLAFVSRFSPKDRTRHTILGIHDSEPYEAAHQLGIDVFNGFGILKALLKQLLSYGDADKRFVVMKDPNKPLLRLYSTGCQTPKAK